MKRALAILLLIWLGAGGCGSGPPKQGAGEAPSFPAVKLIDSTQRAGIDFRHTFGCGEMDNIVKATGSGAALLDYDGDGFLDLYLVNGCHDDTICGKGDGVDRGKGRGKGREDDGATGRLYRNRGDGTFEDVTERAGVRASRYGMGAAAGDYDNDGRPDLFLANYGPNCLYRNRGDGTFEDVTSASGVKGPDRINGYAKWSVCGLFVDYDGDGLLDLMVGNYLTFDPAYRSFYAPQGFPGPQSYLGQASILYRNEGGGKFRDVTEAAGVLRPDGKCMGLSACDYDGDGRPDIYQANDAMEKYLFHNEGKGRFKETALTAGVACNEGGELTASMHGVWGDIDRDGNFDLYVPDLSFGGLYRNLGTGRFLDISIPSGLSAIVGGFPGWGGTILDYDNDGLNDILQLNGGAHHLFGYQALLLRNTGRERFVDASLPAGEFFTVKRVMRGGAFGDMNNDGTIDAVVQCIGPDEKAVLLLCENRTGNHWISFRLTGSGRSPRDALGARIAITAGGTRQYGQVCVQNSYLSACDPRVHFGLGSADTVDKVEVWWPDGTSQSFDNLKADSFYAIAEGGPCAPVRFRQGRP